MRSKMSIRPVPLGRSIALAVLLTFTAINFVNYLDRYVLAAVLESVRLELALDDGEAGLLGTMFMVVYMLFAPLGGYLGDRWNRNRMSALAVMLWSAATIGCGLVEGYGELLTMRALVGVGEAGYATVAPSVIADLFAPTQRGRKLSIFYLAIPLGSALGYLLGGWVGEHFGWRAAFFVAGAPGFLLAITVWFLPEPARGAMDLEDTRAPVSIRESARGVLGSVSWRFNTVGTTLMTFAMGGIAFWMPTYLQRVQNLGAGEANTIFGGLTIVAGLLGTLIGGSLGDRMEARRPGGFLWLSGMGLLCGAPFAAMMPFAPSLALLCGAIFAAEFLLFLNTGPLNAALVASVPAHLRASAVAINVFFIHALGDAISPWLIGVVSGTAGLSIAVALTSVPVAVAGATLLVGARWVRRRATISDVRRL